MAAGDYETAANPFRQATNWGFLLRSFNTMTRKIARSRAIAVQQSTHGGICRKIISNRCMEQLTSGVF